MQTAASWAGFCLQLQAARAGLLGVTHLAPEEAFCQALPARINGRQLTFAAFGCGSISSELMQAAVCRHTAPRCLVDATAVMNSTTICHLALLRFIHTGFGLYAAWAALMLMALLHCTATVACHVLCCVLSCDNLLSSLLSDNGITSMQSLLIMNKHSENGLQSVNTS